MSFADQIKLVCVVGPILGLLVLGFTITLRSGVATVTSCQGMRLVVENLSKTVALLAFCLLGLAIIQQCVGFPLVTIW